MPPFPAELLKVFNGLPQVGDAWYLVDGDTGDVVHEYIAGYEGRFLLGGGSGVDPGGFFLVSRSDPPRELFRAMRFEQRPLDPAGVDAYGRGRVELVDRDSGDNRQSGRLDLSRGRARPGFRWPRHTGPDAGPTSLELSGAAGA